MQGHVRQRGKTWSYVIDLGIINGKRKQKEKGGFATKKEALSAMRSTIIELEKGIYITETKITFSEYLNYYLENYVKVNLRPTTFERYSLTIKNHINPELGHFYLQKLNSAVLQKFFTDMYNKNFAKNTLSNFYGVLSGSLNMALKWGFININPLKMVTIPKKDSQNDVVVLNPDEIALIIDRFKESNFYIPLMIGLHTGMRVAEVCGLQWGSVNFDNRTISVTKILVQIGGKWTFGPPKTKSSTRNILMGDTLYKILKQQKTQQKENKLKYGPYYTDSDFICTKENGENITPDSVKYLSRVVNNKLDIKFKFHYLRHTHATMMLEQGIHPKVVQERLGHSKISTTLDTYSHVSMNMQKDAINIFDNALKQKLPT